MRSKEKIKKECATKISIRIERLDHKLYPQPRREDLNLKSTPIRWLSQGSKPLMAKPSNQCK